MRLHVSTEAKNERESRARRLKQVHEESGKTKRAIIKECKIAQNRLDDLLAGDKTMNIGECQRLAKFFKVSETWLFGFGEEDRFGQEAKLFEKYKIEKLKNDELTKLLQRINILTDNKYIQEQIKINSYVKLKEKEKENEKKYKN